LPSFDELLNSKTKTKPSELPDNNFIFFVSTNRTKVWRRAGRGPPVLILSFKSWIKKISPASHAEFVNNLKGRPFSFSPGI